MAGLQAIRRWSRQIALPEVGIDGQNRISAGRVVVMRAAEGRDLVLDTAVLYLQAAGVENLVSRSLASMTTSAGGPHEALGQGTDVVLRSGFDDDAVLPTAVREGVPLVVARASATTVDVIAFRRHGPCPHQPIDVRPRPSSAPEGPPEAAVLAGTLAATEVLWMLVAPQAGPRARHLRLPLADDDIVAQDIPWSPECFLCGGTGSQASFLP